MRPGPLPLLLCALLMVGGRSGLAEVKARSRAAIVLRVLAYDRALNARGGSVDVVCLYKEGNPASMSEAQALCQALEALHIKIHGQGVRARALAFAGPAELKRQLEVSQTDVLCLAKGLELERASVAQLARALRVRTFGHSRADVEAELGVAVVDDGGKVKIVLNTRATSAEGADYKAKLLRLVERVQGR